MKVARLIANGCLLLPALALGCRDNASSTTTTTGATQPGGDSGVYSQPIGNTGSPNVGTTSGGMNPSGPSITSPPSNTSTVSGSSTLSGGTSDQMLTDAQILQVTHLANAGEIAQARLAQDKSQDQRVKHLAAMMIADHSDADKKGADIAKKESLTLADSPVSSSLKSDVDQTTSELRSKTGTDFDRAYVDAQVKEHQSVIDTIDNRLMTSVKDDSVKSFLQTIRPKLNDHLKHAQKLQADMAK